MSSKRWFTGAAVAFAIAIATSAAFAASTANGPPSAVKTSWGTFTLSDRIAQKIKNHEPLNIGLSMEGQTIPIYGPQYKYGFGVGLTQVGKEYGVKLNGVFLGPVNFDAKQQLDQLRSAISTNAVDCVAVEGGGNPAFGPLINEAISKGIPAFTVGTDIESSHRLATFHTSWTQEGALNAKAAAEFFKAKNIPLKEAWMTTGDISAPFAQQRMQGFMTTLKKLVPGVKFDSTPKTALNTGFDPSAVYSQVKAFIQGHADVQLIYQTDAGTEFIDKVITDLGKEGKIFTVGHNVSLPNLAAIAAGVQIATIDQNYPAQSAYPAVECAAFLLKGKVLPNTNTPNVVNAANVKASRANFIATGGTKPVPKTK